MEIKIYDVIGFGGVNAQEVNNQIDQCENTVHLRINSPGGSVGEAIAIHNYARSSGKKIIVSVDGYAASAASVIMAAGDEVNVFPSSIILLHKPSSAIWGNADDMRKEAETLDVHEDAILEIYSRRMTGKTTDEVKAILRAETWILGSTAVEMGLADNLIDEDEDEEPQSVAAAYSFAAINKKMMEAIMSKTETRKEIAAERDTLADQVTALAATVGQVKADFESANQKAVEAIAARADIEAKYTEAITALDAEKSARAASEKELSDRITAIAEGLKNPAVADAAMLAAGVQNVSISDAEADAAEVAAREASQDDEPTTILAQFESMPHGDAKAEFYTKNKKQILQDMEQANQNK